MTPSARSTRFALLALAALLPGATLAAPRPATPAPARAPAKAKPVASPQRPCRHEARDADERREHARRGCERHEARERNDD